MRKRFLFASAGVIALLIVMFALGNQPTARADVSSMNWDMSMTDVAPAGGNVTGCSNDGDTLIEVGECPTTTAVFDINTTRTASDEPFFDLATEIWKTGPAGTDEDGDTLAEPTTGLAMFQLATLGTRIGRVTFTTRNNLNLIEAANTNNIDDIGANGNCDTTVAGQPPTCGSNQAAVSCTMNADTGKATSGFWPSPFYLWEADKTAQYFVSQLNTDPAVNTLPQTQEDKYGTGQDCSNTTPGYGVPNGLVDGIDCTPAPLPQIQTILGLPSTNYIERGYGMANLPVLPPTTYVPVDVNFLYYNLVADPAIRGYMQVAVVQYPGIAMQDPTQNGYDPTLQTVITCTPYTTLVDIYGQTPGILQSGAATLPELHRKVVGGSSTDVFDFTENVSGFEDWDGDTIPSVFNSSYDRCAIDPNSGTPAQDTDGDTLTGLCETLGSAAGTNYTVPTDPNNPLSGTVIKVYGNGEGTNPEDKAPLGQWNTLCGPPATGCVNVGWDSGQDVDGDGYLNSMDNCPNVPDRDLDNADGDGNPATGIDYQLDTDADGIGDVCEMGLVGLVPGMTGDAWQVPGNGLGYPGRVPPPNCSPTTGQPCYVVGGAPGQFVDRDNVCSDPFSPDTAEPALAETGDDCNNNTDDDGDGRVNDGCPRVGVPEAGSQCADNKDAAEDATADAKVNDGCPPVGDSGRWCAGFDALIGNTIIALKQQFADSNDNALMDYLDQPAGGPIDYMDVSSDSDKDGYSDACEAFLGSDALDSTDTPGAPAVVGDCDNDGTPDTSDPCPFNTAPACVASAPWAGSPLDPDADGDGCTQRQENPDTAIGDEPGTTAAVHSSATDAGLVSYSDRTWYDFYDVPVPAKNDPTPNGPRDRSINMQDVTAVLKYVGAEMNAPSNGKVDYDSDKGVDLNKDGIADIPPDGVPDGMDYDRSPGPPPSPPREAGPPDFAVNMQDVTILLGQVGLDCSLR